MGKNKIEPSMAAQQWKPGQSGNPKGRPDGALGMRTILRNLLEEETELPGKKGESPIKVSRKQLAMMRMIQLAVGYMNPSGHWVEPDLRAITALLDQMEGKPVQPVEVAGGDSPISAIMTVEVAKQLKAFVDEVTSDQ